jgi:hypothetical protein
METPFRVLAVVPTPRDAAWAAEAVAASRSLERSLQPLIESERVELVRLEPATGNALEAVLQQQPFAAIHVVTRGASRAAARYGTLTLEAGDRRARVINAQNFARTCALARGLEVVLLQTVGGTPGELDVLRDAVFEHAASVVYAPDAARDAQAAPEFVRLFYSGLADGRSVEGAFLQATGNPAGLPTHAPHPGEPTLRQRPQIAAVGTSVPPRITARPVASAATPAAAEPAPVVAARTVPSGVDAELQRKRETGAFDVFLCHNVGDKPAVMNVGRQLLSCGILPWLDQWELRPGTPWQRVLEEQIANIHAAAVFVGRDGIGPWQRQELDGFLREFNKRGCPVIPVMLPGAAGEPQLPLFLRGMTWVDFRSEDPDPLSQLVWGITGKRPDHR